FELLNKYGCELFVSIDYPKGMHNKNRTYKDGGKTYDLILKKIKRALMVYPSINISTFSTIRQETNIKDFFSNFPFGNEVDKMHTIDHSLMKKSYYYKKVLRSINAEYKRQYDSILKNSDDFKMSSIFSSRFNSMSADAVYRTTNCNAGLTKVGVSTNGDIYMCCLSLYQGERWKMGNVFTGFDKQKQECLKDKFERLLKDRKVCVSCWARYLCLGPCPISNLNFSPSLDEKNGMCSFLKKRIELEIRLYALVKSKENLRELYPVTLINKRKKDVLTFEELTNYTFAFRELSNQKRNYIKHITPFSPG
ncbi:MAG: SPASM domain-containing protein, partial [Candidatus Firestonebacteria bacterium]